MVQKIFLGIISLCLITFLFMFIPIYKNNLLEIEQSSIKDAKEEFNKLTEEQEKKRLFLNLMGYYITDEYLFDDFGKIVKNLRNYVYNNFEEELRNRGAEYRYSFHINENIDNYEENLTRVVENAYTNVIHNTLGILSEKFANENGYQINDIKRLSHLDLSLRPTRSYEGESIIIDREIIDKYIDVYMSRKFYENEITEKELLDNIVENYIKFLEDYKIDQQNLYK